MTDTLTEYTSPLTGKLESEELPAGSGLDSPDRRDGRVYRCPPALHLALDVALSTGRPLLIRGEAGTGKSSFAAFVARNLGWRYYEYTVTSSTEARDLLWHYDTVRRLADAQSRATLPVESRTPLNDSDYLDPGPLWWAFDRDLAMRRGQAIEQKAKAIVEPFGSVNTYRDGERAVVLIDEIDKADPDVPNALLVPLGSLRFPVTDLGIDVSRRLPASATKKADAGSNGLLVVITTNEERELPAAFIRRCVTIRLRPPSPGDLLEIAKLHFERKEQKLTAAEQATAKQLATRLDFLRESAASQAKRRLPGTAEYLDALRASLSLKIPPDSNDPRWADLERITLVKD